MVKTPGPKPGNAGSSPAGPSKTKYYNQVASFVDAPSVKSVSGRRAFVSSIEAVVARHRGALRSENVGMSNHNSNEKLEP